MGAIKTGRHLTELMQGSNVPWYLDVLQRGCVFKYNSVKCDILMRENSSSEGHGRVYKFFKVLYLYVLNVIMCSEEIKVCPMFEF